MQMHGAALMRRAVVFNNNTIGEMFAQQVQVQRESTLTCTLHSTSQVVEVSYYVYYSACTTTQNTVIRTTCVHTFIHVHKIIKCIFYLKF